MKQSDFDRRLERHLDELRWLYMELYNNESMFAELCQQLMMTGEVHILQDLPVPAYGFCYLEQTQRAI